MKLARANNGKNKNSVLLLLVMLILAAAALAMVLMFVRGSSGFTLEEPMHQFFLTEKTELNAGDRVDLGENSVVFNTEGKRTAGEKTPIYCDNRTVFILPCDYSWVDLKTGREWLVPALSSVETDSSGKIRCVIDGESVPIDGGFMTDSSSTFVFLTETQVFVNGEAMSVSPLSFYSSADAMVRVMDYKTDTMYDLAPDRVQGDSLAVMSGCSLNLTTFVLTDRNGDMRMLVSAPSILTSLKDR